MRALPTLLALLSIPVLAAGPLNDTGITHCGSQPSGNSAAPCTPNPAGQDSQYGRDAAAADLVLTKVGGGSKGFDFTKVCNSGQRAGQGSCPTAPALGTGPNDWACTHDNKTGLMWEVKVNDDTHLRHQGWTYTWYDSAGYGGNNGTANGGSCLNAGRCDTEKFVADVNAATLCGHADWRMPSVMELTNLADLGVAAGSGPTIDVQSFPNTPASPFWTGTPVASITYTAEYVNFWYGSDGRNLRDTPAYVRLVRTGQ